jgi:hypothetical protein
MTGRRDRTIALLRIDSPEALADSLAAAVGGAAIAVALMQSAIAVLRGER